jgi:hypothetical protein
MMYPIVKERRKVYYYKDAVTTWYRCMCKYGTQAVREMLLKDEPAKGIHTCGVSWPSSKGTIWDHLEHFVIDDIQSDGLVFLEKM